MLEDPADRVQAQLARQPRVVGIGQEHVLVALPERDVVVTAVRRHVHERLGHEAGERPQLAAHLAADLPVGGEPVGGQLGPVELPVQLELARGVLVIALDHVQAHRPAVLHHLVDQRLELGELVDVVAVRLGLALDRRRAVRVELEPHHLWLGAHPQVQPGLGLERLVDPVQVAAAVRGQVAAGIHLLFPVPEQGAEDPGGLRIPGQLAERVHVRQPDELGRLRPVPDVLAVAVDEQVGRGAVDQLEAALGDPLPVVGGNALAHDPPGDRDELIVDVADALGVDLRPDALDSLGAPG